MATYIYNWSLSVIYQFYTADMSILLCIWSSVEACNVYYLLTSSFFFLFAKCYFELLMAVRTIWFPRSIIGPAYSIWELFHAMAGSLLLNVKYLRQFHMKASRIRRVTIYLCLSTAFVFSWANYLGIGVHVEEPSMTIVRVTRRIDPAALKMKTQHELQSSLCHSFK